MRRLQPLPHGSRLGLSAQGLTNIWDHATFLYEPPMNADKPRMALRPPWKMKYLLTSVFRATRINADKTACLQSAEGVGGSGSTFFDARGLHQGYWQSMYGACEENSKGQLQGERLVARRA